MNWLEKVLLTKLPGYEFLKSLGGNLLHLDKELHHTVVMAQIEDSWQIGYITEELDNGLFAVFIPDAPVPFSGGLYFMTADRFHRRTFHSQKRNNVFVVWAMDPKHFLTV